MVVQPEAKKVKKVYQVSPEWDKLIKKDTANKNLWDQVKETQVFSRKEFLDKVRQFYIYTGYQVTTYFILIK